MARPSSVDTSVDVLPAIARIGNTIDSHQHACALFAVEHRGTQRDDAPRGVLTERMSINLRIKSPRSASGSVQAAPDSLCGTRQSIHLREMPRSPEDDVGRATRVRQVFGRQLRVVERPDGNRRFDVGGGLHRKVGSENQTSMSIQTTHGW